MIEFLMILGYNDVMALNNQPGSEPEYKAEKPKSADLKETIQTGLNKGEILRKQNRSETLGSLSVLGEKVEHNAEAADAQKELQASEDNTKKLLNEVAEKSALGQFAQYRSNLKELFPKDGKAEELIDKIKQDPQGLGMKYNSDLV